MPKMKTRRAAAKRFSKTANGKFKIKKQGLRHILTKHSSKRKRQLGMPGYVHSSDVSRVQKQLPYA